MDQPLYRRWFALPVRQVSPPEPDLRRPARQPAAAPPTVRVFSYGGDAFEEAVVQDPAELASWKGRAPVTWVDVDGVADPEVVRKVSAMFGLHGLAVDDVLNPTQRPKVERYDGHVFVVARMLFVEGDVLESEQLSLFLGPDYVVSFQQQRPGDSLGGVRTRLRSGEGRLRRTGPDFLAWALLDAVVDGYFPALEAYGERLDALEDRILDRPTPECIADIHQVKRDLLAVRRATWPLREALNQLLRDESPLVSAETRVYLRDCHDHAVQLMDMMETYREVVAGLMESYQSSVGNRLNAVMKVLTIIATVFMPLSFLAAVYGMNFHPDAGPWNMPELGWPHGYLFFWSVAVVVAGAMLWAFRRQGWLGGKGRWD